MRPSASFLLLPSVATIILLFLSSQHSAADAAPRPSNVTDRLVLLSFKSLLKPTDLLSSWKDSTNVCGWFGVTCGAKRHPERITSLALADLDLGGTLSPSLGNLSFLVNLTLRQNNIEGSIPKEIGRLRRLQWLDLTFNSLEGQIPGSLTLCTNLELLYLNDNKLHGGVPANLSRLPNLQVLTLQRNMLTGEIPSEFGSFESLRVLDLENNNLTGRIPPSTSNISFLSHLHLSGNNLVGNIPSELSKLVKLSRLELAFNDLSGEIPPSLFNFSMLYDFFVGGNKLEGTLPSTFAQNLPSLVYLQLQDNHFEGSIPPSLINASRLEWVILSNNSFSGPVTQSLGTFQNLTELILANNKLVARNTDEWRFIDSLTNCTRLEVIDLSSNNFSGVLPSSIANLSTKLEWLRLRENQIAGNIPLGIGDLSGLVTLDFRSNRLSGPIPSSIGKLKNLRAFLVTSNKLSGELPASLGNLAHMLELYMGDNNFSGGIPSSLSSLEKMIVLDISHNDLSGNVPEALLRISSLSLFLNMSHNSFTGKLPSEIGRLRNLKTLDASENKFSSEIPGSLGQCQLLQFLYLEGNQFTGEIPDGLKGLRGIQILDLSRNHLSGIIPRFFETWGALQYLNLSFNDFEGAVPTAGAFNNASLFSLEGNDKLCGGVTQLNLKPCSLNNTTPSTKWIAIIIVVVVSGTILLLLIAYALLSRRKSNMKSSKRASSWRGNHFLQLSHADITRATNGFSPENLIGSGGYGSVYKGTLDDGMEIAVKVLNQEVGSASKSFVAECNVLRNVRHRNLVSVITTCSSEDAQGNEFKALVYEFMPNGSLMSWLYDSMLETLDLEERLDIAHNVASAIHYLHTQTEMAIVHCDLKPSNILLDRDLVAHVSDFGISRFLSSDSMTITSDVKGSLGYIAPGEKLDLHVYNLKYRYGIRSYGVGNRHGTVTTRACLPLYVIAECGMGVRISTRWDVYSYGILLLEIFTGKSPTDKAFVEGLNLRKYVQVSFPEDVLDVADPKLLPKPMEDSERWKIRAKLQEIMKIGLACSEDSPNDRMLMEEVLWRLDDIRDQYLMIP